MPAHPIRHAGMSLCVFSPCLLCITTRILVLSCPCASIIVTQVRVQYPCFHCSLFCRITVEFRVRDERCATITGSYARTVVHLQWGMWFLGFRFSKCQPRYF